MSRNPYYNWNLGIGHGADWGNTRSFRDHPTRDSWPPEYAYDRDEPRSTFSSRSTSGYQASIARTRYGNNLNGGAATFYPGQNSHYYHNMKGEWEDDDF